MDLILMSIFALAIRGFAPLCPPGVISLSKAGNRLAATRKHRVFPQTSLTLCGQTEHTVGPVFWGLDWSSNQASRIKSIVVLKWLV
jgi:hypothetical protein